MGKRKYFSEVALNLYSSSPLLLSPYGIYKISKHEKVLSTDFSDRNIYLITKRNRVSILPNSLKVGIHQISVILEIKTRDSPIYKNFQLKNDLKSNEKLEVSSYPHRALEIYSLSGQLIKSYPIQLILHLICDVDELQDLEVLYIGQAYGKKGQRTAIQRLSSHSTLQRILSDIAEEEPHMEIIIALYKFEFSRNMVHFDGQESPIYQDKEDDVHYRKILNEKITRNMEISIVEAALIRYFQPVYNIVYKYGFPSEKQKILKKLYSLDFLSLIVEVNTDEFKINLFTKKQERKNHHIVNVNLHSHKERRSFIENNL